MKTLNTSDNIDVPAEVAVCPYCGAELHVAIEQISAGDDGIWQADLVNVHCKAEPPTESALWDVWLSGHYYMPYVYQLPVDNTVIDWLNRSYRFSDDS